MAVDYRVQSKFGGMFAYDDQGAPVDQQTLFEIIKGLHETCKQMDGRSQGLVERDYWTKTMKRILSEAVIHLPPTHPFTCFNGQAYRKPDAKRFAGVYVLSTVDDPDTVKVGISGDIYTRTKGIYHQYKSHIKLHAILEHEEYRLLERFLHWEFLEHNVSGEWFAAEPVLKYIKGLAP